MARNISKEEMKIIKSIEKLPFSDEEKKEWAEVINTVGMNEEIAKEMLSKSASLSPGENEDILDHNRSTAELNRNIRNWRLSINLRVFSNRGRRRRT
ncbi:MAG: hypothetical protein MUO76_07090 [Anaerolineaceae bacterium]|jgi:hypothetical protein|nr:hypothetical protein [Anaerolineaceae bacterium]